LGKIDFGNIYFGKQLFPQEFFGQKPFDRKNLKTLGQPGLKLEMAKIGY
jgi:hypothetical protein